MEETELKRAKPPCKTAPPRSVDPTTPSLVSWVGSPASAWEGPGTTATSPPTTLGWGHAPTALAPPTQTRFALQAQKSSFYGWGERAGLTAELKHRRQAQTLWLPASTRNGDRKRTALSSHGRERSSTAKAESGSGLVPAGPIWPEDGSQKDGLSHKRPSSCGPSNPARKMGGIDVARQYSRTRRHTPGKISILLATRFLMLDNTRATKLKSNFHPLVERVHASSKGSSLSLL